MSAGGGFKFDFSVSEGDESACADVLREESISDGDELIHKMQQRCRTSACTVVNASSRSLSNGTEEIQSATKGKCPNESVAGSLFEPKLGFHRHEMVDLCASTLDPIRYVIPQHTLSDETTDLIPGVYEGGLKVWECSVDLCRFLASIIEQICSRKGMDIDTQDDFNNDHMGDLEFVRQAVSRSITRGGLTMELGCGHGLPGCLILRESIRKTLSNNSHSSEHDSVVLFSDFNDFVLQYATIPNAQINVSGLRSCDGVGLDEVIAAQSLLMSSVFSGGDWMGLSHKISSGSLEWVTDTDGRFDLILAAETTYTIESCNDTAFLMLKHLKIDSGVGLVATKRFYFGVGGGTDMFTKAAKTLSASSVKPFSHHRLVVRTIRSYDTGNANIRDLLEVRCLRRE
ncbi:hypothetical protein HJC23_010511 [Cyclotella cryptica]|uniref:protein-histidine N-methyltransferase n=1 Tax=Cyclotella cryptica TaxID=29204 RepID=A0ABD3QHC0_9STRA|eukprot:CCRYP_007081-RA/>CCRYP_007081-RA protein AED:0.12 eAED:0.12 QI:0/-1/0/1/-1/1/1/0/399